MNMFFKFISLIFLPLFLLSGCSDSPSSMVAQFSDAVSKYENCLAQKDKTCNKDQYKEQAISLFNEIEGMSIDDSFFFSVLDFKREDRKKQLRIDFNAAKVKITKALFADSDYRQAAFFLYKTKHLFNEQDRMIMIGALVKNITAIPDLRKNALSRIIDSYNLPYETFLINISYELYPYSVPSHTITLLEKYNCYADAALITNYFVKYDKQTYNELSEKYNEIMSNLSKEEIRDLNKKTRDLINHEQKPSLSSDCELNFYKKLN